MSSNPYDTDYEIGQDNVQVMGLDVHNPVFAISAVLIVSFILFAIVFPAGAESALGGAKAWSIAHGDWLFMLAGNLFVLFCLLLIVRGLRLLIETITAFTVAHSITLALATLGYATIPAPPRSGRAIRFPIWDP